MKSMKTLLGSAVFLMLLLTITIPLAEGATSAMYQVDDNNSGFYPEVYDSNTFSPIPIWEEETTFTVYSNPISIDLDDDGVMDVIYATASGSLKVMTGDWETLWEFPADATQISTPAVADVDKDGDLDVVFAANGVDKDGEEEAMLYCLDHGGLEKWRFPLPSFSEQSFPTISEIQPSKPGLEILISVGKTPQGIATTTSLLCIDALGAELWEYKEVELFFDITSTPVVENIVDDSSPEVILGITGNGGIVVLDSDGNEVWKEKPGFRYTSPITYNIDKAGRPEVIFGANNALFCYDNLGNELWHYTMGMSIFSTPVAKDIDGDNEVEILAVSDFIYCLYSNGTLKWKQPLLDKIQYSSIAFGDINSGEPEILVGDNNGTFYAFDNTGEPVWNVSYGTAMQSSPVITDLNDDGTPELLVTMERGERTIMSFLDLPLTEVIPEVDFSLDYLAVEPATPVANRMVKFTAEFTNSGNVFSSADVVLFIDGTKVDSQYLALPPTFSRELTLEWMGVTGIHNAEIVVDPRNDVPETNEGNNKRTIELDVINEFIDLVIGAEDIQYEEKSEAEFYRVNIKIRNSGNLPAENFTVEMNVNGEAEYLFIDRLRAESFTYRSKTVSAEDRKRIYIGVTLDFNDDIEEVNESNNYAEEFITVENTATNPEDDPELEDYIYLLILIPIILVIIVFYFSNNSAKKNYEMMQNTLDELKKAMAMRGGEPPASPPISFYQPPAQERDTINEDHGPPITTPPEQRTAEESTADGGLE